MFLHVGFTWAEWVLSVTRVEKGGELGKGRERVRGRDRRSAREPRALVKNESKQAAGPARPRGAARPTGPFCNPPGPGDARGHRGLSKSAAAALRGAHVPGVPQASPGRRATRDEERGGRRAFPSGTVTVGPQKSAGEEGVLRTTSRRHLPRPTKKSLHVTSPLLTFGFGSYGLLTNHPDNLTKTGS